MCSLGKNYIAHLFRSASATFHPKNDSIVFGKLIKRGVKHPFCSSKYDSACENCCIISVLSGIATLAWRLQILNGVINQISIKGVVQPY